MVRCSLRHFHVRTALAGLLVGVVLLTRMAAMPEPAQTKPAAASAVSGQPADAQGRALIDRYCVSCHNSRLKTAGLVLDRDAVDVANVGASSEIWEKVARKVRSRA